MTRNETPMDSDKIKGRKEVTKSYSNNAQSDISIITQGSFYNKGGNSVFERLFNSSQKENTNILINNTEVAKKRI